jgi:hypothetical protein
MDSFGDSFNLSIITNIDLTSKLFTKIASICEVMKVMFDQKDKSLKGIKATVNVAPRVVNFLGMNEKSSEVEGYIDGTVS